MGWDFREGFEIELSDQYISKGYIIGKGLLGEIDRIKEFVNKKFHDYLSVHARGSICSLEDAHKAISGSSSNEVRMHVLREIWKERDISRSYYRNCKEIVDMLCGNEVAMQKRIGLSMQLPRNSRDELPIHSDTWNGVSPYDLNILTPLVDCEKTKGLYILNRCEYQIALKTYPGLLKEDSSRIFRILEPQLEWVELRYGEFLAFDQCLPHGYSINEEDTTHWSLNCRFKSLFSPYSDKKLGEYFMPITTRACTRLGLEYREPTEWVR